MVETGGRGAALIRAGLGMPLGIVDRNGVHEGLVKVVDEVVKKKRQNKNEENQKRRVVRRAIEGEGRRRKK